MRTDAMFHSRRSALRRSTVAPIGAAAAVLSLAVLFPLSPYSLASAFFDGGRALLVVAPPCLLGVAVTRVVTGGRLAPRWGALLGCAFGLGAFSLILLGLGLVGALRRPTVIALHVALTSTSVVVFAWHALSARRARAEPEGVSALRRAVPEHAERDLSSLWMWLAVAPFLALCAHAAAQAPGFIWREEGFAYDVLEYHLQVPREFVEAGRVAYLPHNVYAMFPLNVEMLYATAMLLRGEPIDAAVSCNFVHLSLGALTVFAVWVGAGEGSRSAGRTAAVAMASTGWLVYLSGLAYVELGLLFFGASSAAALARSLRRKEAATDGSAAARGALGWSAVAGAFAGLACGCKYTGVAMVALPLGLASMLRTSRSEPWAARLGRGGVFAVSCLVTFGPWLARSAFTTGNPVFPLVNRWFDAAPPGFGPDDAERWDRGHKAPGEGSGGGGARPALVIAGLSEFVGKIVLDPMQRFGPAILVLGVVGLWGRRRGVLDQAWILTLAVQMVVWVMATHWFARFGVVMLIPLSLLAGRAVGEDEVIPELDRGDPDAGGGSSAGGRARSAVGGAGPGERDASKAGHGPNRQRARPRIGGRVRERCVFAAVVLGSGWNLFFTWGVVGAECLPVAPADWFRDGRVPGFEYLGALNRDLPPGAKVLMVGDAKAFYVEASADYFVVFNELPFAAVLEQSTEPGDVIRWLRTQSYTHVLVNWSEVRRLAGTYGFSPAVTPVRFETLRRAGLELVRDFTLPGAKDESPPYIHLYRVPASNDHGHEDGPSKGYGKPWNPVTAPEMSWKLTV